MEFLAAQRGGRVALSEKYMVCLGDDSIDDLGSLGNVMDQPNAFTGHDSRNIEIAGGLGRGVFGGDVPYILQELEFAASPAPRMIVNQAASGKWCRPHAVP